ncbi:MAG TPA: M1 family aminopeptidase [Nocardioidaceae bacterium]
MDRDRWLLPRLRSEATEAFDWLVKHAGPYPFSSLGIVVVGGQSAMETQTMITASRDILDVPGANLEHEMAHQWFGDSVSPVDWRGLWLNEGWAMYMQQWYESDTGRPGWGGGMRAWPLRPGQLR